MPAQEGERAEQLPAAPEAEPTTTAELLGRSRAGDLSAEQRVFAAHIDSLRWRVQRHASMALLARHMTEEDIVHDVFVRALSAGLLDRFDDRGKGSLERMLAAVLEFVLKDALRRCGAAKRQPARAVLSLSGDELGLSVDTPVCAAPSPTSQARAGELRRLARAVLDDRQWTIWSAIEMAGLDSVEVARLQGSTPSAVRGVLLRARRRLLAGLESPAAGQAVMPAGALEPSASPAGTDAAQGQPIDALGS